MKKLFLIGVLLITFLTIASVSATDENQTSDNLAVDEDMQVESSNILYDEQLSANNSGTFKELSSLIENAPYDGVLKLDKDYVKDKSTSEDGITISKQIVIDGNNHVLDGKSASRIFNLRSTSVTLKNIIFKNGNAVCGGAIYCADNCIISNCTFINCQATESGAVHFIRSYGYSDGGHGMEYGCYNASISNCTFISCSAINGGATCYFDQSMEGIIKNCNFINCNANNGGAIYFYPYSVENDGRYFTYYYFNSRGTIFNCSFFNCYAQNGGAIYIGKDYATEEDDISYFGAKINSTISNCSFMDCSATNGGSVYWDSLDGKIENSNFTSSYAKNGGAVYADNNINLAVVNSNFINNTAEELGSAVYGGVISNCRFSGNDEPEIYGLYQPELKLYKNYRITYCPIIMKFPRDTVGNFSLYVLDSENYTFMDCTNITADLAEINFKSPKVGDIKIRTLAETNYGVFESLGETTITSIEFEGLDDPHYYNGPYLNSSYEVKVVLPQDGEGNFTLYADNNLFECVNFRNGTATISFKTLNKGKHHFEAICISNYGYEKVINDITFKDGTNMYIFGVDEGNYGYCDEIFYNDKGKYVVEVWGIDGKKVPKNTVVNIKIGSKNIKAKTDSEGFARINLPKLNPGKHTITAKYKSLKDSRELTVKHIVTLKTVKVKKSAKKLTIEATLKNKKAISGKYITFKFNGKTYKAKTNSKGIAKATVPKSALKNLKVGKTVTYQATYIKDTVKKTAKVLK